MQEKVIKYRGATTTFNEIKADNSQRTKALDDNNPELIYRGSSLKHS